MMRSVLIAVVAAAIMLLSAAELQAGGGCPRTANSLEAFAGCMVVMPGNTGTMYRGTRYDLDDNAHAGVMNAMHSAPVVPAQVIPAGVPYTGVGYGVFPSMVSVAASKAYKSNSHSTFWTWWAFNNAMGYPRY